MRKLHPDWDRAKIIDYNLRPKPGSTERGTAFTIFESGQNYRVMLTRTFISEIIAQQPGRLTIVEPGCSAGDISGWFATDHDVWMSDVVPGAVNAAHERWPLATTELGIAEEFAPRACDILVLCEFLEHIVDPVAFASAWLPLARNVVISHPLVGDGYDPEIGHLWAYTLDDFHNWFALGGFDLVREQRFQMGYDMIIGRGQRPEPTVARVPRQPREPIEQRVPTPRVSRGADERTVDDERTASNARAVERE